MTLLNNWLASLPFMTAERADYVISSFWPMMEGAILYTIPLAVISFFCGLFIAVIVAVICTLPHPNLMTKILQGICRTYISIIRGTPMLVQIFIIFYGLPEVGIQLEPFPTASYAIGMNYTQAFVRTIMPQALRISVPSLSNTFISTVKDTSLASLVWIAELFRVAQNITAENYEFILIYSEAALIYWVFCFVLSMGQTRLEKRLSRHL